MGSDPNRVVLAALIAVLVFIIAYIAVTYAVYVVLPDHWEHSDYAHFIEYTTEQSATVTEVLVPGLLAALVYRLIKGSSNGTSTE